MAIIYKQELQSKGELAIWDMVEDENYFLQRLDLYPQERLQYQRLKGRRRKEWLAARYLLHLLSGRKIRGICLKDEYGKPYLENSLYHISISHSYHKAAVIASPYVVGIDIQYRVPKIVGIAHKFVNQQEKEMSPYSSEIDFYHTIWGAKECLFKAYGRKEVNFKEHFHIFWDEKPEAKGTFKGYIHKGDYEAEFDISYQWFDHEYLLVWSIQTETAPTISMGEI